MLLFDPKTSLQIFPKKIIQVNFKTDLLQLYAKNQKKFTGQFFIKLENFILGTFGPKNSKQNFSQKKIIWDNSKNLSCCNFM